MEHTYSILREFADSWFLLFMFGFFVAAGLFAFRPGSRKIHEEIAQSIFRNDSRPASPGPRDEEARNGRA